MGDPVLQGCRGLGSLSNVSLVITTDGLNITLYNGSNTPPCGGRGGHRALVYELICDKTVPPDGPPEKVVVESPGCTYNVKWHHPSVCPDAQKHVPECTHTAPPPPAPLPCTTCLPPWKPTYDTKRSTVLMTCNDTGMHSVAEAVKYGVVVYDWSNAKQLWANAHPMNDDELLTKQALMVLAADPGHPGYAPRVWVYR